MKKSLLVICMLSFILSTSFLTKGQGTLKFRLGGNSARFLGETQGKEINYPLVDTLILYNGPFTDFSNKGGLGFEAEIMSALSDKFWIGFEISSDMMTGENDNPGLFNFQFTDSLHLQATSRLTDTIYIFRTNDPIKYKTSLLNFMANFRFYPLSGSNFRPFLKASAGLSLVSTELSLKNPALWMVDTTLIYGPPVLYSNSETGLVPALSLGGGIGCELQLTDKLGLYTDWTYRMVKCDILDGKPNFNYNLETKTLDRFNTWSTYGKFSFGIVYTLSETSSLFGGGGSKSKKGESGGMTSPHLPFYKLKPR
jgi:hypothetical protein